MCIGSMQIRAGSKSGVRVATSGFLRIRVIFLGKHGIGIMPIASVQERVIELRAFHAESMANR